MNKGSYFIYDNHVAHLDEVLSGSGDKRSQRNMFRGRSRLSCQVQENDIATGKLYIATVHHSEDFLMLSNSLRAIVIFNHSSLFVIYNVYF